MQLRLPSADHEAGHLPRSTELRCGRPDSGVIFFPLVSGIHELNAVTLFILPMAPMLLDPSSAPIPIRLIPASASVFCVVCEYNE
eukprot:scaffold121291_cov19-Tisochrysis_lutea.AAC.1